MTHEDYSVLAYNTTQFGGEVLLLYTYDGANQVPKTSWYQSTKLCYVTSQNAVIFTFTAVKHKYLTNGGHTSTKL
jgi:hypothetical protein